MGSFLMTLPKTKSGVGMLPFSGPPVQQGYTDLLLVLAFHSRKCNIPRSNVNSQLLSSHPRIVLIWASQ